MQFFQNLTPYLSWIWNFPPLKFQSRRQVDRFMTWCLMLSDKQFRPSKQQSNKWRAPTSCATIHSSPFGLKSFAKPDMASQNRARNCVDIISYQPLDTTSCVILQSHVWLCKALSPKGKLWIAALLVGAIHICKMPAMFSIKRRGHLA